jgi:hypothetical protein
MDAYIKLIKEYMPPAPTESIINIDKCSFSDWEERKPKPVLIPAQFQRLVLRYQVNRAITYQSLICCVTAARNAYYHLLVLTEHSVTEVFNSGPRDGVNLKNEVAKSACVAKEIFKSYADTVLMPAVESNRTFEWFNGEPAILLCDNCSAHCTEDILQRLTGHAVIVLTYPRYTSHISQVLDVLLLGVLKRAKKNQRCDDELPTQVGRVLRLFRASEQVTTSTPVRVSCVGTGFQCEERDNARYLTVNKAAIWASTGLREALGFDPVLDSLSARR